MALLKSGPFNLKEAIMTLFRRIALASIVLLGTISPLLAQRVYFTNEPKKNLQVVNLAIGKTSVSTLYSIGAEPDDLILNSAGQLIYTVPSTGTVNLYDPVANTNTVLASGLKYARDLIIEPGGETMLIGIYTPGKIVRYTFATGTTTTLTQKLGTCDGIAYDGFGNLYAVANHSTIVQIDPVSGAVLSTLALEPHNGLNGADGLTFDPFTGNLWATQAGSLAKGLFEIFTNDFGFTGTFNSYVFTTQLKGSAPDGIKSDGKGNLYVGAINTIFVYNIPSNAITKSVIVGGADGVSLVPGTY